MSDSRLQQWIQALERAAWLIRTDASTPELREAAAILDDVRTEIFEMQGDGSVSSLTFRTVRERINDAIRLLQASPSFPA